MGAERRRPEEGAAAAETHTSGGRSANDYRRSRRRRAVTAGGGVFFTGLTIHGSYANLSPSKYRRAFAIHYVGQGTWVYRSDIQQLVEVNLQNTEGENYQTS